MSDNKRKISLKEDLFHKLFNKHREAARITLAQLLPITGMHEISSEIFPKKIPDRIYQSENWDDDPRLFFLDLTVEVNPDDIYKMNTYRSWGLERVAAKLPRRRKYHEPDERVHGALLSILSPSEEDLVLARDYHIDILSLEEGLPIELPSSSYVKVGAPFVLGKLSWLRHQQVPLEHWIESFKEAVQALRDDENEIAFLLGWGRLILPSGSEASFIKQVIDNIIREELRMSSTMVVRKVLQAWDVPPEDSKIIARILEGMDPEQRKIVLAALEGMDPEQRKIVLAALEDTDERRRDVLSRVLDLPPEKLEQLSRLLKDPEKLERLLDLMESS